MNTIKDLTKDILQEYVIESNNWVELSRLCGYNNIGNNQYLIKKLDDYNIDYSKFNNNIKLNKLQKKYKLEDIFCENSTYNKSNKIRDYLISDMNFEYKCNICGIIDWMGKFINLEIDHINGNHTDNRIENLRFLCPLCHSFTDTYKGKNKGKTDKSTKKCISCNKVLDNDNIRCDNCQELSDKTKIKPSIEELENLLKDTTIKDIAKKYEVSKQTVNNWIRENN